MLNLDQSDVNKLAKTKIINISAKTVIFDNNTDSKSLNFFLVTFVILEIVITSLAINFNLFTLIRIHNLKNLIKYF